MAYLALYRKYRPSSFDSVIGQDHIVKILKAQIKGGNIGHAYLFCGARGTGKTTAAKIFARAINCETPVNGSPCGKCAVCKALAGSGSMDILEIDAASNNKVEEVRDIRENVQYPPVNGRYKVYIIDEVHMLTDSAFNALLKTLEEPPRHAVFILATTEVYKLPATILSRCMRFDFRLVPKAVIAEHIKGILKDIGKPFEDAAVSEIARAGEGSVRDALSVADMCVSYSEGTLKYSDVLELLSASDRDRVTFLANAVLSGGTGEALKCIDSLSSAGKSIPVLNKDIISYLRDLTVIKSCQNPESILDLPSDVLEKYKEGSKGFGINDILRAIGLFSSIETELRYSLHPRIVFEAAAVKASNPQFDGSAEALSARVKELETAVKNLSAGIGIKNTAAGIAENGGIKENAPATREEAEPYQDIPDPVPPQAENGESEGISQTAVKEAAVKETAEKGIESSAEGVSAENQEAPKPQTPEKSAQAIWGGVIRALRQGNTGFLYTVCANLEAGISGNDFIVYAGDDMAAEVLNKPKNYNALKSIINSGREYNVIIRKKGEEKSGREKDIEILNELSEGKLIIKD